MKKIGYVITQSEMGGAQKNVLLLADEFLKRGYKVDVICGGQGDLKKLCEEKGIGYICDPYMVREINLPVDFKNFKYLKSLFKENNYDIVHSHSSKAGLLARMAAKSAGIKKNIYTAHGFVFNEPMSNLKKKIYIWCEKYGAKCGDEVIAVSKKDYDCALDYKISSKENTVYIPNAIKNIDRDSLKPKEKLLGELGVNKDDFIIGNVSNFYDTKGHVYLMDALMRLLDEGYKFTALFAGEGKNLQDMKDKTKNYDSIKYLGYRKDNYDIMNALDLFVLPSVKEGMPYVILEAMNLGKTVLCTKVGALTDMIKDGDNGYIVEPQSSDALYEKLKYILDNKDKYYLGDKGEEYVKSTFSFESVIDKIEKIYS